MKYRKKLTAYDKIHNPTKSGYYEHTNGEPVEWQAIEMPAQGIELYVLHMIGSSLPPELHTDKSIKWLGFEEVRDEN